MGLILIVIIALYAYYKPYIDFTETQIILWYNKDNERTFKILWNE